MRTELADKYLKAHGMVVTRGEHKQQVFMPYIVMDKARELAAHSIGKLTLRHEAKRWRGELKRVYHDFYSDFFRPYTQDEVDEIIESFDGFERFIDNELQLTRVAVSNAVDFLDFELQMTMTDIFLTQITAQCAAIIYYDGFAANAPEAHRHNKHIERFERLTMKIGNAWYRSTGNTRTIASNEIPALDKALSRYAMKIANYNEQI